MICCVVFVPAENPAPRSLPRVQWAPHQWGLPAVHRESPHPKTFPLIFCFSHWSISWSRNKVVSVTQYTEIYRTSVCSILQCWRPLPKLHDKFTEKMWKADILIWLKSVIFVSSTYSMCVLLVLDGHLFCVEACHYFDFVFER